MVEQRTSLRSIYKAGCLFEYGSLTESSVVDYSFNESLSTCKNKSYENVSSRACKILRKLLPEFPKNELMIMAGRRFTYYADYYKDDKKALIEEVINRLSSSFVVKYHEWENKSESIDS